MSRSKGIIITVGRLVMMTKKETLYYSFIQALACRCDEQYDRVIRFRNLRHWEMAEAHKRSLELEIRFLHKLVVKKPDRFLKITAGG